jgi:DNA (cytosine-5)-methyltransferase 1
VVTAIYNEIDGYAARWLRNLVEAGAIAPGAVETRSIRDLRPEDVRDATQLHTFAGIGGWSYALRLAGWPDGTPVWTGSCPCQPFSRAGKGAGFADDRHLWPAWFELIRECRPGVVLGEQVAGPAGLAWLDVVFADLEREGYAVGAADLAAASVAAPHIRQRIYFVGVLADADSQRLNRIGVRTPSRMGDADREPSWWDGRAVPCEEGGARRMRAVDHGPRAASDNVLSAWSDAEWIDCSDGRSRPAQPGSFPLAYGLPERMGRGGSMEARARVGELRGYGNAIVPQVAAEWIGAVMDTIGIRRTA